MITTREASWTTILLFLVLQTLAIVLVVLYSRQFLMPIAQATGWIIHTDLLAGVLLLVVIVGGIILWQGGLRLKDIGLIASHVPLAVLVTAGIWISVQLAMGIGAFVEQGSLTWHPYWSNPGVVPMLGFLVAMLVGIPLYEEVAFRGFLFPQLFAKLGGSGRGRLVAAAVLSAVVFALVHIPTRLLLAQVELTALASHLAVLTFAGLFGVILYIRTGNLLLVTGIHGLVNAPTSLFDSPVSPFVVTLVLSVVLWIVWPRLQRNRADADLPVIVFVPPDRSSSQITVGRQI